MNEEQRTELITELCDYLGINNNTEDKEYKKLISILNSAIRTVIKLINFPERYTEEMIKDYLKKYYDNIRDITIYDYLQDGAVGEISHSENGTSRTWKSRRECFIGIDSFAKSF